jgi:hypothetical protein
VRSGFVAAGFLLLIASIPSIGETADAIITAAAGTGVEFAGVKTGESPGTAPASTVVPPVVAPPAAPGVVSPPPAPPFPTDSHPSPRPLLSRPLPKRPPTGSSPPARSIFR